MGYKMKSSVKDLAFNGQSFKMNSPLDALTTAEAQKQGNTKFVDKDNNNVSDYIQKPTEKKAKVTGNTTVSHDKNTKKNSTKTSTTKKKSKGTDWAAMQKKSAKNDPRYGEMSAEDYKTEALRQSKSKNDGKGYDAMGVYDSKGKKKATTETAKGSGPTEPKKVGKGNQDVSGYEKDNVYDLKAEKHKLKDERLEKRQDKRTAKMKKTEENIEKNKFVKGEGAGKNIGRFFKRVGGKLKNAARRGATNVNRKKQVKQETKINELEAQKKKSQEAKSSTLGKENTTASKTKGKGKNNETKDDKKGRSKFKNQMLKESLDALGTHV
tara:strand:+ start:126 stop:1097 length:972 start_codon:yes stop_codon:yes gene_type:complete